MSTLQCSLYPAMICAGVFWVVVMVLPVSMPVLPFGDHEFDTALCSHFLFLYSGQLSEDFHVRSIRELCRVAADVRIFPLLELGAVPSRHLDSVIARLEKEQYTVSVETVSYEFQKGGNKLLRVTA